MIPGGLFVSPWDRLDRLMSHPVVVASEDVRELPFTAENVPNSGFVMTVEEEAYELGALNDLADLTAKHGPWEAAKALFVERTGS